MTNKVLNMPDMEVIVAATNGDEDALDVLLSHYEGYISKLCTRIIIDNDGNKHSYVDNDMKNKLKTRFIMRTLAFGIV